MKNKSPLKTDAHSLYNMGMAYIAKGDFTKGKQSLLKAVELDKKNPEFKHALGAMLINEILQGRNDHFNLTEADVRQLELAEQYLTQSIKILETTERKKQLENTYIHRSVSRAVLDKRMDAIQDINKAIELFPNNPVSYDQRAKILMADNRIPEAIEDFLMAIKKGANKNEIAPMVVSAFIEVPQPLPDEALKFIKKVYEKNELEELLLPQSMLIKCYIAKKEFSKARELIDNLYEKFGREISLLTAEARLEKRLDNYEKYEAILKEVIEKGSGVEKVLGIVDLAQYYRNSKQFDKAIPLYENLLVEGRADSALNDYLICLYNAKENRTINIEKCLSIIIDFEKRGQQIPSLLEIQLAIYQELGKIEEAVEILEKLIKIENLEYRHRVNYAVALVQIGGKNNLTKAKKNLLQVKDKLINDKRYLTLFVKVMARMGEQEEAIRGAFQLISIDSSNPENQMLYTTLFLSRGKKMDFLESKEVKEDFYVKLDVNGNEKFYLVNNDPNADFTKNEVYKQSEFGKAIYGKKSNDEFILKSKGSSEKIKILEIKSKFVKLYQDVMENFNKLFPESRDLIKMEGGKDSFVVEVEKMLKGRHEHVDEIVALYRNRQLTIGALALLLKVDIYEAWLGLVKDKGLYCADSSIEEQKGGLEIVINAHEIVIDPIAIFTLRHIDLFNSLDSHFKKVYIPRSFVEELDLIIQGFRTRLEQESGMIYYQEGKVRGVKISPDEIKAHLDFLVGIKNSIGKTLIPLGFDKVQDADGEKRDQAFGETYSSIIQICQEKNLPYFSDDLMFRQITKEFKTNSFGIQSFLAGGLNKGLISEQQFYDKIISIVKLKYDYLSVSSGLLFYSITMNYLQTDPLDEFKILLGILKDPRSTPISVVHVSTEFIKLLYVEKMPTEMRTTILNLILEILSSKIDPKSVIGVLRKFLPAKLGLVDYLMPQIIKDTERWLQPKLIL